MLITPSLGRNLLVLIKKSVLILPISVEARMLVSVRKHINQGYNTNEITFIRPKQ